MSEDPKKSRQADPGETSEVDLGLIRLSIRSTTAFTAFSALTYLTEDSLDLVYAIVCGVVFVIGVLLFALGMWNGIQRSRVDEVTLTGLVAIDGTHVPRSARNLLWLSVAVQIIVSIGFASLRPFSQQAFGLLVPVLGLGLATLWGSRFAAFHPRDDT